MSYVLPNRVPAGPIVQVVNEYLLEEGERRSDGSFEPFPISMLAERADIIDDTLSKILEGRSRTIDFDLADKLICVMNVPDFWRTRLQAVYEEARFDEGRIRRKGVSASGIKVCQRQGCSVKFVPTKHAPYQRFCSSTCRAADWKHRNVGIKTNLHGKGGRLRQFVCKNGHERTKENTRILGGRTYCLICKREKDRLYQELRYAKIKAARNGT